MSEHQRLLGGWPEVGDVVGCKWICHSVYEPLTLMLQDEMAKWLQIRKRIPYDIAEAFFPIRRPLQLVDLSLRRAADLVAA